MKSAAADTEINNGALYLVATPIGNLADITLRAIDTLKKVDLILAEDTRRAAILMRHYQIHTPLKSHHAHNEAAQHGAILQKLQSGARIALISDAGTPLICDPGHRLVAAARMQKIAVIAIPGASALLVAVCAAKQSAARFCFEGFLPIKREARLRRLRELADDSRTQIIYESAHRIAATLTDIAAVCGEAREMSLAREMTKQFETYYGDTVAEVIAAINQSPRHRKGEFVIILGGANPPRQAAHVDVDAREIMQLLTADLPPKRAAKIAAKILKMRVKDLYEIGLDIKD